MRALLESAPRFPGKRWRGGREAQKDSDPTFTIPPSHWVLESKRGRGEVVGGAKNRAQEEEGALG